MTLPDLQLNVTKFPAIQARFSVIFQYSPATSGPHDNRLLLIAQTTNHEMGFEMDDYYGNPSTDSENYRNALVRDIEYVNNLTCLEVFGSLVGEACLPNLSNWKRMVKLWAGGETRSTAVSGHFYGTN